MTVWIVTLRDIKYRTPHHRYSPTKHHSTGILSLMNALNSLESIIQAPSSLGTGS